MKKLLLFCGPCQLESEQHAISIAEQLKEFVKDLPIDLVFKSSFDKANRTSLKSQRGIGIEESLKIFRKIKTDLGLDSITDIHESWQAEVLGAELEYLQIPAFLCRQTDLLIAAGKTGKTINIKKGQFLHPADMKFSAEKVASTGNEKILLCERGTCFGYRELIVDFRGLMIMKDLGYPVIFDATHSVQVMGGADGKSSGARKYVGSLAKAASAIGIDGLFLETHENPDQAPSDGPNMVPINEVKNLLEKICEIRKL